MRTIWTPADVTTAATDNHPGKSCQETGAFREGEPFFYRDLARPMGGKKGLCRMEGLFPFAVLQKVHIKIFQIKIIYIEQIIQKQNY